MEFHFEYGCFARYKRFGKDIRTQKGFQSSNIRRFVFDLQSCSLFSHVIQLLKLYLKLKPFNKVNYLRVQDENEFYEVQPILKIIDYKILCNFLNNFIYKIISNELIGKIYTLLYSNQQKIKFYLFYRSQNIG